MKICVLGSGSSGNCIYIGCESGAGILIDAGLSYSETVKRMEQVGVDLGGVAGICVTHEHSDHRSSLGVIQRKTGVPLYANSGTIEGVERDEKLTGLNWNVFETGASFMIKGFQVEPFSVPHDSYDPVGFIVSENGIKVGVVTDMGMVTGLIRNRLKGCAAVILESNHDEEMLKSSGRPWPLKQRISGRQGHLSNAQAAELVVEIACPELRAVFLAHLSQDCNTPGAARAALEPVLKAQALDHVRVLMTYPDRVSELLDLGQVL